MWWALLHYVLDDVVSTGVPSVKSGVHRRGDAACGATWRPSNSFINASILSPHIPMNAKHEDGLRAAAAPGSGGCGLHQHHIRIGAPWIYTCWQGAAIDTGDLFQRWTIVSELPNPLSRIERRREHGDRPAPRWGRRGSGAGVREDQLARCGDARGKITMPPAHG